jgi:hypothetical protein
MARKVLTQIGYTFTPAQKTLVFPKHIKQEKLVLVTNVTTNQVIYNFSDPALKATSYVALVNGDGSESTTIIFNYNTLGMNATDKIQIVFEDQDETFEPSAAYTDPTNKLRVTTPQALIDTDFEYGSQTTKWENITMTDNRPFAFQSSNGVPNITTSPGITMSGRTVTVTTSSAHGLAVGTPITVQDTFLGVANGNFIIESVTTGAPFTFTYTARAANTTSITNLFDVNKTIIYTGTVYSNAQIGGAPTITGTGTTKMTVTTTVPHGLSIGNEVAVTGVVAGTSGPPNGSFYVASVLSPTQFIYYTSVAPSGALTTTNAKVYARPQGQVLHRPFDGGVIFSANANSNNQATIRQTRRYFRYQSGKGIQISSGTVLKPNLQLDSLSANGTTITVQTREQHNLVPGVAITISGASDAAYNGTYTIENVTGFNKFTYTSLTAPTAAVGAGPYYASVTSWYGCLNRLGIYDQQNGLFWEFDGQTLYAVRRSSTFQLSGKVTVTNGSNVVTRTGADFPTNFSNQVEVGDYVVIRGQSYQVNGIASNESLTITPSYRGATAQYAIISKTVDTKIPQSDFNLDTIDGNGPSGYNIDLSKMQMFYIDYSWYGAGFVRWGIRATDGNVIYVHKMPNNNINEESYMRSGNLPGRYETITHPPSTQLALTLNSGDTSITVDSTDGFPSSGTLFIRPSSTTNQAGLLFEGVNYTGKTSTEFTGVTRGQSGGTYTASGTSGSNIITVTSGANLQIGQRVIQANVPSGTFISDISADGLTLTLSQALTGTLASDTITCAQMGGADGTPAYAFTYTQSPTSPTAVELAFPTYSSSISHWGTSVIMDGRFDEDKSLLFTYGQSVFTTIAGSGGTTSTVTTNGTTGATLSTGNPLIIPGMTITGATIAPGTTVQAISGTSLTLSVAASSSGTQTLTFTGLTSKALFSIRVAPSVDNGIPAAFGSRELINRMQLVLRALDITTRTASVNLLVTAVLNGVPSGSTTWRNVVQDSASLASSSLSQIADYAAGSVTVSGGENTGGFFVNSTQSIDLSNVRDLGNAILGGGGATANVNIYPDGPDVLTIVVTNLAAATADVVGRLSWTEAQA